jgi:hypothetical protein
MIRYSFVFHIHSISNELHLGNQDYFSIACLTLRPKLRLWASTRFFCAKWCCLMGFVLVSEYRKRIILLIRSSRGLLLLLVILASIIDVRGAAAQKGTGTIRVAQAGGVAHECGSEVDPCPTIQDAVQRALPGDTILVAGGTYKDVFLCLNEYTVLCVLNKKVTIIGGYSSSNWDTPDPVANPTVFDGQGIYRVGIVQGPLPPDPLAAGLDLENVTIANGYRKGAPSGSDEATFVFGGGIEDNYGLLVLRHVVFKNNKAVGGDTNQEHGGAGSGGGLAMRFAPAGTYLEHVTFDHNQAFGGTGASRGGYGIGGGLYTLVSVVAGHDITLTNNSAIGGDTTGSGRTSDGGQGDAQGGGVTFQGGSTINFQHIVATNNTATGGNSPNGEAAGAFGGAIKAEGVPWIGDTTTVNLTDADIRGNVAQGGMGQDGGYGSGGGVETNDSNMILNRVWLVDNRASGGNGSHKQGPAGGGGGSFQRLDSRDISSYIAFTNTVIADNLAAVGSGNAVGGGGGGLWLQGTQATINHSTFAHNQLSQSPMQGSAILVLNDGAASASIANISYSIIANHTGPGSAAVYVKANNIATLTYTLWAGNSQSYYQATAAIVNDTNAISASTANFVSPGAPNYDYHILKSSPARNAASGSSMDIDIDGESRLLFPPADIGADEYVPIVLSAVPFANAALRLSWKTNAALVTGIHHYEISISCESGANCRGTANAGSQTSYVFSNLTNYKNYSFTVTAKNSSNGSIDSSNLATAMPVGNFVYLPLVLK